MIIRVSGNIDKFLKKCIDNHINIVIKERAKDNIIVKINEKDYKNIKKLSLYTKIQKIRSTNYKFALDILKKYYIDFLYLILFIIIIYAFSNVIVKVDINHENKELKNKVNELLKENKISKYTFVKNNKKLNIISDKIFKNNRDILDFIAINRNGMKYIVSIEERIIKNNNVEDNYCNVIATHDAIINKITVYKGISLVEKNQYVKKGDILISGDLILNEELKSQVCASGNIRGTTWYKINIIMPKTHEYYEYSKRGKYNLSINNRLLLKNKYKLYDQKIVYQFLNIKLVKLKEKFIKKEKYSDEEVKNIAIKRAREELLKKNNAKMVIIDEKVLNINNFNSKIELELFFSVEQDVGQMKSGDYIDTE